MPPPKERVPPCVNCKEKHLKCKSFSCNPCGKFSRTKGDGEVPCSPCKRSGQKCVRTPKGYRFKKPPRFKSSLNFSADQPWMQSRKSGGLSFVDETELMAQNAQERRSEPPPESGKAGGRNRSTLSPVGTRSPAPNDVVDLDVGNSPFSARTDGGSSLLNTCSTNAQVNTFVALGRSQSASTTKRAPSFTQQSPPYISETYTSPKERLVWQQHPNLHATSPFSNSGGAQNFDDASVATPVTIALSLAASSPLRGFPETISENAYLSLQEACLVRHFVDNLACWFDASDRDRHFAVVVPQRAMICPTLLYAVLTASAGHLTRIWLKTSPQRVIEFNGIPLPGLDEKSAIRYHNVCISHLIEISSDPTQTYNEDALTAATILRFFEQIDTVLTGCDAETYLNVVQAVINTQQDESFYALYKIKGPVRDSDSFETPAISLRHSACLVALRQEIWSVLLYRRPFRFPVSPNNNYSQLESTDDYTWTNRILVWTADVLRFCFGGENSINGETRVERWETLKKFEKTWQTLQPPSFKPLHYQESDPLAGKHFPDIWHMNECQVIGLQHFELSKTLLATYDPNLHRLGLGTASHRRALDAQIRQSTLLLCGLALSNQKCPSAMVTAALWISLCGEYFSGCDEQDALVHFMEYLEDEHAWPTQNVIKALRESWNVH